MTEPERLLERSTDSFLGEALRAAAADRGSAEAFARALSAAGSAAVLPLSAAPIAKTSSLVLALKGVSVGLAVGVGCVTASVLIQDKWGAARVPVTAAAVSTKSKSAPSKDPASLAPALAASNGHADAVASAAVPVALPDTPASASAAPPSSPRDVTAGTSVDANAAPEAPSGTTAFSTQETKLAREVQLLDEARREVARGNMALALAALDRRDLEFEAPVLEPEATVIRVEALLGRGDKARAVAIGRQFLLKTPSGRLAERVRRLIAE